MLCITGIRGNFSKGGGTSTFCSSFSGFWRCNSNLPSQNALHSLHLKESTLCYSNSHKTAFVGSSSQEHDGNLSWNTTQASTIEQMNSENTPQQKHLCAHYPLRCQNEILEQRGSTTFDLRTVLQKRDPWGSLPTKSCIWQELRKRR